jgi:mycothiol system anti-sigma-R factor
MIDCREAVRRMWDYLEQALEPRPLAELEAHLDDCTRCCGELEFNRHLRQMVAERQSAPIMPPELRARVEQLLAASDARVEREK